MPDVAKRCLLLAWTLTGCRTGLRVTPLEDLYHLEVATTRSSYAPGDSVVVRITNNDAFPFVWHRCPGALLQLHSSSKWTEVSDGGSCNPGQIGFSAGSTLAIAFVMPASAAAGEYRVQVRLSPIDAGTSQFWWPSGTFQVTSP